jgi:hypothetical protein
MITPLVVNEPVFSIILNIPPLVTPFDGENNTLQPYLKKDFVFVKIGSA